VKGKRKICVTMLAVAMVFAVSVLAAGQDPAQPAPVKLETEMDKASYALGTRIGQGFKQGGVEINMDLFMRGIKDVLAERELALSAEEAQQVMADFNQRMMARQQEMLRQEAAANLAEGTAFLEENKTKPGVVVLPSGLQYKVFEEGTGRMPTATERVKVHYRGTFVNGEEFDSSYKRNEPVEFQVRGVIAGWTEALQLMKEGAKWQLFIPANLAYGERGRPPSMPPNSTLIFEVELIEVLQ
jgi:FKBP-type peptidyl-prolyl cis-trans isomerase FklB